MSTYYSGSYEQAQKQREQAVANAPKECPYCHTSINQNLKPWDKVRHHCGSDRCRKAVSRANIAERKRQERSAARARVYQFCEQHLSRDQKRAVMEMTDMLMTWNDDEGHEIAERVVAVLDDKRCKHDRIAQLEQNALLWQRRAQESERQLKERIAELESELELFTSLQDTIHGIATRQLAKQPDPEPLPSTPTLEEEPEQSEDDQRTRAILDHLGLKPYTGSPDQLEEDDQEEDGEEESDEEDEE